MMDRSTDLFIRNQQNQIEIEALEAYNAVLVSCFEKLLYLANEKAKHEIMSVNDLVSMKAAVNHCFLAFVSTRYL